MGRWVVAGRWWLGGSVASQREGLGGSLPTFEERLPRSRASLIYALCVAPRPSYLWVSRAPSLSLGGAWALGRRVSGRVPSRRCLAHPYVSTRLGRPGGIRAACLPSPASGSGSSRGERTCRHFNTPLGALTRFARRVRSVWTWQTGGVVAVCRVFVWAAQDGFGLTLLWSRCEPGAGEGRPETETNQTSRRTS